MQVANKLMKKDIQSSGNQEMQIKLQMDKGEKGYPNSAESVGRTPSCIFQGLWIVSSFSVSTKIKRIAPECGSQSVNWGAWNTSTDFQQSDFISDAKPPMSQVAENTITILVRFLWVTSEGVVYCPVCGLGPLTCKDQTTSLPCSVFGLGWAPTIFLCFCSLFMSIVESEQEGPGTLMPKECWVGLL